jgi:hypothetical protein
MTTHTTAAECGFCAFNRPMTRYVPDPVELISPLAHTLSVVSGCNMLRCYARPHPSVGSDSWQLDAHMSLTDPCSQPAAYDCCREWDSSDCPRAGTLPPTAPVCVVSLSHGQNKFRHHFTRFRHTQFFNILFLNEGNGLKEKYLCAQHTQNIFIE